LGSLKNHFHKEFFKEPIMVSQRTFTKRLFKLYGTISGSSKNLSNQGSLKNHFLEEFIKEPIKVSQRPLNKWLFKAPSLVPQRTFPTRVV